MITLDEKILRGTCENVLPEEVESILGKLERGLQYSALMGRPGIGLAAPQISMMKKAAIIRLTDTSINLVNADIKEMYSPFIFKNEGCLSVAEKTGNTKRYNEIVVANNMVAPHSFVATGLLAVVIQHEIDHINGKLFLDRLVLEKNKQKPNDPCICGKINKETGKILKFKRCCSKL